jgi:hypothetical protein
VHDVISKLLSVRKQNFENDCALPITRHTQHRRLGAEDRWPGSLSSCTGATACVGIRGRVSRARRPWPGDSGRRTHGSRRVGHLASAWVIDNHRLMHRRPGVAADSARVLERTYVLSLDVCQWPGCGNLTIDKRGGVAFFAHVGGLTCGLLVARLLGRAGQTAPREQ